MDDARFDTLTRTLGLVGSRRRTLSALLLGFLGLLGEQDGEEVRAHDVLKKCKKIKAKAKRKKCVKKAKAHNAQHAAEPPMPTCSDGVKNGSESDVDCGGSCPRCTGAKQCTTRHDCSTSLCVSGRCTTCSGAEQCGVDSDGTPCGCSLTENGPSCTKSNTAVIEVTQCTECPADRVCNNSPVPGRAFCYKLCGTPQ